MDLILKEPCVHKSCKKSGLKKDFICVYPLKKIHSHIKA